jgi:putative nucleotidyltransferase with HDIG domain
VSIRVRPQMPPKLAHLPAFPSVATKLLALIAQEDSSFTSIASCIATDPALAGVLIRRANAADQHHFCEVRDVLQAAVTLGLNRTREISLATATSTYAGAALKSEALRPCWYHTLACAILSTEVARLWGLRAAEAYTAGLLHDIGRLGLLAAYPVEYAEIIGQSEGHGDGLVALERERFGVDHVEVGEWLAQRWNLPASIIETIVRHHETLAGTVNQVTVVQIGCRLADLLGFSANSGDAAANLDEISAGLPEWARERLATQLPALQRMVAKEIRLFEGTESAPEETPDAAQETPHAASATPDAEMGDGEREQGTPADLPAAAAAYNLPSLPALFTVFAVLLFLVAIFVRR